MMGMLKNPVTLCFLEVNNGKEQTERMNTRDHDDPI
jgi:hypothetical protein